MNFYILGSKTRRPASRKTIFVDGTHDDSFREGVDLELSHWIPNRTPDRFRADTSTEICMNFIREELTDEWDLAINNHLDVDGVLSVFTLLHPDFAQKYRTVIVEAAEMGDFWAWGEEGAQRLFQGLTLKMKALRGAKTDIRRIYEECFEEVFRLVEDAHPNVWVQTGMDALRESVDRVERGEICRTVVHPRLVHYAIPRHLAEASLIKALHIPTFNAPLSDDMWLHPQTRNRLDREKVHLVSVDTERGTYYDLWYPGYMWADTPNSWRAPGFYFSGSTNGYYYGHRPLEKAVEKLGAIEPNRGRWIIARELSPFSSITGRNYPVVVSFMGEDGSPAPSGISSDSVAEILSEAFAESHHFGLKELNR
ncbi:hypothetical protein JIR001_29800 [Polycladomyces abyssicola]|uniref:Uncharacterized protein n=1 Tax=Polycladomyces abyssicola TaxID=1125966 RepID=A0A8D5UK21_9BACL|nr:DUF6687 family protein [Polycladomyces abyssicola]BCU83197.1 hypothetical protein JIR001_29800 [Polycladomyces abyssicola]